MTKIENKVKPVTANITKVSNRMLLAHEHDFVSATTTAKGTNRSLFFRCITCNAYYCHMCGKVLAATPVEEAASSIASSSAPISKTLVSLESSR